MDTFFNKSPADVFTPSAPIRVSDRLIGRKSELERCIECLSEPGTHLALYGRRGVGKTSLLNVFLNVSQDIHPSKRIIRYVCAHGDTYRDIFHSLLTDINCHIHERLVSTTHEREISAKAKIPFAEGGGLSKRVTESNYELHWDTELRPSQLAKSYLDGEYVFVIDEFDRIVDSDTKLYMSDVLKAISDNGFMSKFVLVGISDSTTELVGKHPSVERCIKSVPLIPLTISGISEILIHGFQRLELECSRVVVRLISRICSGFPHYAHLTGLELARHANRQKKHNINIADYHKILDLIILNVAGPVRDDYFDFIYPNGNVNRLYDGTRNIESLMRELVTLAASTHSRMSLKDLSEESTKLLDMKISAVRNERGHSRGYYDGLLSLAIITEGDIEEMLNDDMESIFHIITTGAVRMIEFKNPMVKAFAWFSLNNFLNSTSNSKN